MAASNNGVFITKKMCHVVFHDCSMIKDESNTKKIKFFVIFSIFSGFLMNGKLKNSVCDAVWLQNQPLCSSTNDT
jgi:hypothetical protein